MSARREKQLRRLERRVAALEDKVKATGTPTYQAMDARWERAPGGKTEGKTFLQKIASIFKA